jgi:hypothetical protein
MGVREVPPDLRRFIAAAIPSVPFLEAMLLLRSDAPASWSPARLAQRLYVSPADAASLLKALCASGMARPSGEDGQVQFDPQTPELAGLLHRLAETYSSNLVGVTDLIHSRVDKRAQRFADAFRWRKDDNQ